MFPIENNKEKIVNNIITHFDFEKVHKMMTAVDWKWYRPESGNTEIPTIDDLRDTATELLYTALNRDMLLRRLGTGGFYVTRNIDDDNITQVKLEFIAEHWDAEFTNL